MPIYVVRNAPEPEPVIPIPAWCMTDEDRAWFAEQAKVAGARIFEADERGLPLRPAALWIGGV